jgi:hypothetical protein
VLETSFFVVLAALGFEILAQNRLHDTYSMEPVPSLEANWFSAGQ